MNFTHIENRLKDLFKKDLNSFLRNASGVIHVGANTGQERNLYKKFNLQVIWIEPIPQVFEELKNNIRNHKNQKAFMYLFTDQDDKKYTFHIANNFGASSSILHLKKHKDIWPEVSYTKDIILKSTTLDTFIKKEKIDISKYDTLVMDTQGSELLVLRGAVSNLRNFKYIQTEVPDFESYKGCCQVTDIDSFLKKLGFVEFSRKKFAQSPKGGKYFDIVYKRK